MTLSFEDFVAQNSEVARVSDRFLHDQRGPINTIRGFSEELIKTVERFRELIESNRSELSEKLYGELISVVEKDAEPCLNFLAQAVVQANENLDVLSTQVNAASDLDQ